MSPGMCLNDNEFGPSVVGCRGDFDFTQKFERIVLSIIPNSVYIALVLTRLVVLAQRPKIVAGEFLKLSKLLVLGLYAVLQLTVLILVASKPEVIVPGLTTTASSLVLVASVSSIPLSFLEHGNAKKPSALLGIYMLLTLLLDAAQLRTAWLQIPQGQQLSTTGIFTAAVALKVAVLILEAIPKTRWINWVAKDHSPEESMSIFTQATWSWLNRLLLRGNRSILDIEGLYPLDTRMTAFRLHGKLQRKLRLEKCQADPKYGLFKDLFRTLAEPFLLPVAPRIAYIGFKFCQPFLIKATLAYLSENQDHRRKDIGYGLIGATFFIYTMMAVSKGFFDYYNTQAVYKARGCLSAAIYRKTTKAKATAADDSAALTLMSTDIERSILGGHFAHEVWASFIEVAIGLWLLEEQLGLAFLAPVVTIGVCAGITTAVLRLVGKRQKAWMEVIEYRVGLTANAISQMKLYKLSGMTQTITQHIQSIREREIRVGRRLRWLMILCVGMGFTPVALSPIFTFAVTVRDLDVSTMFTSLSYIILVCQPLGLVFQILPTVLSALACLQRMQKFLVAEPRADFRVFVSGSPNENSEKESESDTDRTLRDHRCAFSIEDGAFGWTPTETTTLSGMNTVIPAESLTMVVGPVASGKSTFCKVLLGEIPYASGTVKSYQPPQSIGFCEQTPFLYNASLMDNIIGHNSFDQAKFDRVIDATLLGTDIALLPEGAHTSIGSGGIMLSGGQKQRVSVARSLYSESKLLIFDDILSGLDADTGTELFRRVFGPDGLVRQSKVTAIVCTHSVRHLPSADHIIALGVNGKIIEQGSFADLSKNESYIQSLKIKDVADEGQQKSNPSSSHKTRSPKPAASEMKKSLQDKARKNGDWTVYVYWFRSVQPLSTVGLVFFSALYAFCNNFATIWLRYWTGDTFGKSNSFYLGIYALIRVLDIVSLVMVCIMTSITMITFAGSRLHRDAITTVGKAPLSFFTSTDTGTVTNLFSQDMTLIDGELLIGMTNVSLQLPQVIGMFFVVAAAAPYLAIGYPFLFGILYFIQRFYLKTSRQMRLLDLEAKSPLYTNFIDTIKGVSTIRAFNWEDELIKKNDALLDTSQRPAYLLAMIQQWLAVVMQLVVAGLAVVLISLATQLKTNAGLTGASLISLLNFGDTLSHLIMSYTILETCLGAVNRLRTFSETVKPEDQPDEDIEPPQSWPEEGKITMKNVSASYGSVSESPSERESDQSEKEDTPDERVLRDINLVISPGQKVALCGRTGSGKSSLILLMARMLDMTPSSGGSVIIDDIDLRGIHRATLRERLIAIPQDAVFLPDGTSIQLNVDPLKVATKEECVSALQAVSLSGFVEARGGIDSTMSSDELSAGQKQLFSLARAILRKRVRDRVTNRQGGILLLDEVSSNVDGDTDRAMQEIIKSEFAAYTILMVSHRLEMVVDYFDRVVVLDQGAIVETGVPKELIEIEGSRFGELWKISHQAKA